MARDDESAGRTRQRPVPGTSMADRVRSHDWAATPLGPRDAWPPALRIAVGMVIDSRFPQSLMWGPALIQIYNDAYAVILEARHPAALGQRADACWRDIWAEIGPGIAHVMASGEPVFEEDRSFTFASDGGPVQRWFSYSWSPVRDEGGTIRGVLTTVLETSPQVRARLENDRLLQETHAYEERLRLAMQSPSLGTWDMDPDTLAVRWSDNTLRIFGFRSNRDLESRAPLERVHPDDRGRVAAAVAAALAACSDGVFSQRYRIVRPDGSIRWIRSTGQARFEDRDGTRKAVRLAGVLWDVTEQQQLIESLRDSEERARLALAGADMGVWRHDSATDVVEFDALAMAHYDFDRQAVQIAEVLARIHPDDLASMKQSMAASRDPANRAPVSMEYRVIDRSGREKWLAVSGRVHFERRDGVERWVRGIGTSRDVSEQKAAEAALRESEQRFRLLADSTPHIVWAARPDGYSDYFNERWYEFTGMPRPDEPGGEHDPAGSGQGWNWKDWLHPDDFQPTIDAWERSLATGEPYRVEYRFKRRDGQYRWFIGRALPLRDETGRITRWFGTLSDVHDQTVDALQREALIGRLREADNAKDEFLAMLAHEIRGPLGPVRTALAVLDREPLAAHAQRAVAIGRRQLAQVTHIVDDLLEASRITRGVIELRPERVMVQHVVRAAADSVEQAIVERGQRLRFDMPERPVSLYVDPVRLAQILENLLTNAAKYTDAGGDIVVRVRQAADEVRIEVADSGIGIAPEHLPRIFDLFAQVETAIDRSRGGLGIGLSLVKRLAEQHGGSVTARSEGLGRGSTFTLRLPG